MKHSLGDAQTIRIFLALGVLGTLMMFAGDILLYGDLSHAEMTPESIVETMRNMDKYRVMTGGAVGPLASILYCFGFFGLAGLVRPEYPGIRAAIFLAFCAGAFYGGASYHSLFPPMAFAVAADGQGVIPAVDEYIDLIGLIAFSLWGLASVLFHYAVLRGRTHCRKWIALLAPLPMGLLVVVMMHLPPPLLIIIGGGWYSLMMTIFFTAGLVEAGRPRPVYAEQAA